RGEGRNTSAPKRAVSRLDAPMAIIAMAQQAKPNVMGQIELLRTQFTALSNVVRMRPSGGSSPNVTVRMRLASCSLPTVFSKRSSPFIVLLYYFVLGTSQRQPPNGNAINLKTMRTAPI